MCRRVFNKTIIKLGPTGYGDDHNQVGNTPLVGYFMTSYPARPLRIIVKYSDRTDRCKISTSPKKTGIQQQLVRSTPVGIVAQVTSPSISTHFNSSDGC